jgi:RND family efflux transporter MFP subunit
VKASNSSIFLAAILAALAMTVIARPARAAESQSPSLAPIRLSPERRQLIGLRIAAVEERDVSLELAATGNVMPSERLQSYVQTRVAGWIGDVFANQTYQYVRKGEPLFTLYSPELVSTQEEYLIALKSHDRVRNSDVSGVAEAASSLAASAAERLRLFGVAEREIKRLERERKVRHALEIDSPATGYVVERNALPNMYVQPETLLFKITELSKIWVYAAIFQDDAARVKAGDRAVVTVDSYPGESFDGRVDFIWPEIDPMTRTVKVRCEFDNRNLRLKPGMFAHVALSAALGRRLVIPEGGVLRTGVRSVAFIDRGDGYLMPTEVELGPRVGADYVVLKGLRRGDQIVASANFLIDSESQIQAAIGAWAPPPSGAAGAGGQPAMAVPAATLEITTDPTPPSRGRNRIRIALRDAAGKPVSGAQVSISFFMAAMPAMGMPPMRAQANAAEEKPGVYAADLELGSGGTWQATVVAAKDGKTLATRQLNLSVAGPMSM